MSLSDEERSRIIEEEQLRSSIQKELNPSAKKSKLIEFLNSNLGMFILSTVIVGVISFAYDYVQTDLEEQRKQSQIEIEKKRAERKALEERIFTETKLRDEVHLRFSILEKINDTLDKNEAMDIDLVIHGNSISEKIKAKYLNFGSLYQEYKNWSIIRLLREYCRVERNEKNKSNAFNVLELISKNRKTINELSLNYHVTTRENRILPRGAVIYEDYFPKKDKSNKNILNPKTRGFKYYTRYYYYENGNRKVLPLSDQPIGNIYVLKDQVPDLVLAIKTFLKEFK
ncbi:MAG: hypothetical protein NXI10_15145 [bacterium]|nr:hypothetical protein [bacterium]